MQHTALNTQHTIRKTSYTHVAYSISPPLTQAAHDAKPTTVNATHMHTQAAHYALAIQTMVTGGSALTFMATSDLGVARLNASTKLKALHLKVS